MSFITFWVLVTYGVPKRQYIAAVVFELEVLKVDPELEKVGNQCFRKPSLPISDDLQSTSSSFFRFGKLQLDFSPRFF